MRDAENGPQFVEDVRDREARAGVGDAVDDVADAGGHGLGVATGEPVGETAGLLPPLGDEAAGAAGRLGAVTDGVHVRVARRQVGVDEDAAVEVDPGRPARVLICGSLYLAGEILKANGTPPA